MKDGFDKNVAEKMPKIQKVRPNRPWNINPVQLPARADEGETDTETAETVLFEQNAAQITTVEKEYTEPKTETPHPSQSNVAEMKHAEKALKEIDSQFTSMIMENKEAKHLLGLKESELEEAMKEIAGLREQISDLQNIAVSAGQQNREIDFLSEQIQDANLYIQGLLAMISEKDAAVKEQTALRLGLEERLANIETEIKDRAQLDVKAAILERDLEAAHKRIKSLESLLEDESRKRKPLEDEIVELKSTLEQVHSSLAQIRLKAKREAYGF